MAGIRVAAVQMHYQPTTRTTISGWRLNEPLSPLNPLEKVPPAASLERLKSSDPLLRKLADRAMNASRKEYEANFTEKVWDILSFCYHSRVDLVVFPEYSIPIAAVRALREFSNSMAIIAGIGYVQGTDLDGLREFKIDVGGVKQGNNAAVILSPQGDCLLSKKHEAAEEKIETGSGPIRVDLQLAGTTVSVAVAICLDFKNEISLIEQYDPDLVVIPALSPNTAVFVDQPPSNYARVFANHAAFGGTYFGSPFIKELDFARPEGTDPLEPGQEAIVIVEWDHRHPRQEKPTNTRATGHRLVGRAQVIYRGRDPEVAAAVERFDQLRSEEPHVDDFVKISQESLNRIDDSGARAGRRFHILRQSLEVLRNSPETVLVQELDSLSRHCVLRPDVLSDAEWKYKHCVSIVEQMKRVQDDVAPDIIYKSLLEYETSARQAAADVRPELVAPRHKGPTVEADDVANDRAQLVLFARLGYHESQRVVDSLPRQLTLLQTIASSYASHPKLQLRYRLRTFRDKEAPGLLHPTFEIICSTRGSTREEVEELREGLGQQIHITFSHAFSMSYTTNNTEMEEALADVRETANWWAELRPADTSEFSIFPTQRPADWGLVIDLLRSLENTCVIEMQCIARPAAPEGTGDGKPPITIDLGHDSTEDGVRQAGSMFLRLRSEGRSDRRRLLLRVVVGSDAPLPRTVIDSLGVELTGSDQYEVFEGKGLAPNDDSVALDQPGVTPADALLIFHPPFGRMYQTSGGKRDDLYLVTNETGFPPTGIVLGKARVRQVRADESIEVRLLEKDRLRHMYVIGKTGTGKTNLLKRMASQDVQLPGRGITIIDPHGDLVDHVLREVPEWRLNEVVLIDLSRTDSLPVLNPLDIDRSNLTLRDRTIQELILLLHSRVFHENTGPRFDELVRLVFRTMLDEGYSEPASFVEVPRILMDEAVQDSIVPFLKDDELRERWEFQGTIRRDNEFGSLVHWITSKFDDIVRDTTLRAVMGGSRATVKIEDVVLENGILLVRIPEAVIGRQASDFIGSLILLQLKMAIIRRRELGKLSHFHFVYVDEFQNFANTDFHSLVAEARKFNMGFTLAHQNLEQLREFRSYTGFHEQRLINAILGNMANMVIFSVGAFDASTLSDHLGVPSKDILRVGRYEAIAKTLVDGSETPAFTLQIPEAVRRESPRSLETIENRMNRVFWRERAEILDEIPTRIGRLLDRKKQHDKEEEERKRIEREHAAAEGRVRGEDARIFDRLRRGRAGDNLRGDGQAGDGIWSIYDIDRVRRALSESAGALNGMDHEGLLQELRGQRGQHRNGRGS